jgi:hypothetical protein
VQQLPVLDTCSPKRRSYNLKFTGHSANHHQAQLSLGANRSILPVVLQRRGLKKNQFAVTQLSPCVPCSELTAFSSSFRVYHAPRRLFDAACIRLSHRSGPVLGTVTVQTISRAMFLPAYNTAFIRSITRGNVVAGFTHTLK